MSISNLSSSDDMGISQRAPESLRKNFFNKFMKQEEESKREHPLNEFIDEEYSQNRFEKINLDSDSLRQKEKQIRTPVKNQEVRLQFPQGRGSRFKDIPPVKLEAKDRKERENSKSRFFEGNDEKVCFFVGDSAHITKELKEDAYNDVSQSFFTNAVNALVQISKRLILFRVLLKYLPTIHPDSGIKLLWNIFICICIVFQFFTISIELFFDSNWDKVDEKLEYIAFYLSETLKYCLLLDAVLNSVTGYYNQGDLIMDKKKILKNYLRRFLLIDVLVILPIFLDFDDNSSQSQERRSAFYNSKLSIIKLLFVFRMIKLRRTFQTIDFIISNNVKIEGMISLLKLVSKIIFTAHMFACIWYLIGDLSWRNGYDNWRSMYFKENVDIDWRTFYIHSLYWSITTMITVGYGDITPVNNLEICFVIISMIFGCGLFGYSLNNIGIIFEKIFAKESQLRIKLRIINRYMKRKNINYQLQGKVRRYLTFIMKEFLHENAHEEHELIGKLSSSLKKELLIEANGQILSKTPLLANNFSVKTIQKLAEIFEPIDLAPEEYVYEEGERETERLYFVMKGKLCVFLRCESERKDPITKLKTIREGDVFGEYSFFTGKNRELNVMSMSYTRLYVINKAKFLEIIQKENDDYETFCRIRDSILLYNDSSLFYKKCYACGEIDHEITNCRALKYIPKRSDIVNKYLRRRVVQRTEFSRRKRGSKNTLMTLNALGQVKEKLEENYDFAGYETDLNKLRSYSNETIIMPKLNLELDEPKNIIRSKSSQEIPVTQDQHEQIMNTLEDQNNSFLKIPADQEPLSWGPSSQSAKDILQKSSISHSDDEHEKIDNKFPSSHLTSDRPSTDSAKRKRSLNFELAKNYQKEVSNVSTNLKKVTPLPINRDEARKQSQLVENIFNNNLHNQPKAAVMTNIYDMSFDVGANFKNYFPISNRASVIKGMKKVEIKTDFPLKKSNRGKSDRRIIDVGGVQLSPKKTLSRSIKYDSKFPKK